MKKTLATLLALALAVSCVGMLFVSADDPLPEGAQEFQLSHVNCYSWGGFYDMVAYGEGRNCQNLNTGAMPCDYWIALKVDNVDGVYTVTQIEGNGEAKTMTASADGFIMYLYSANTNYPDNFVAAQEIEVGYTVYSHTFDWTTDVASETALGNIVLAPPSASSESSEDAVSSENATSSEETVSSEAATSSEEAVSSEETVSSETPATSSEEAVSSEAPATSSETAASSEPVQTGDAGIIVFAVLGIAAIAGVAVAVKVRH